MMHVTPVSVNRGPNQAGVSPPNPPPTWDGGQGQSKNATIAPLKPKLQEEKKICGEDLAADDLEKKFYNTQHTKTLRLLC